MNIKKIFLYLLFGISWGSTFFVLTGLISFAFGGESAIEPLFENYVSYSIGAIIIGVACATSAIVYTMDKLSAGFQVFIHFAVGLSVYFVVAYSLKWIDFELNRRLLSFIVVTLLMFSVVWFIFYLLNRSEAKKINQRLKYLQKEEKNKKTSI